MTKPVDLKEVLKAKAKLAERKPDPDALDPWVEEQLNLTFTARHAAGLRYCDSFGHWYVWSNGYWRQDIKRGVFSHDLLPEQHTRLAPGFADLQSPAVAAGA